jgi:hypothetical protein
MRFTHPGAPENYMFWALSARKEVFEEDDITLLASQGDAAAKISARLTAMWDPRIRIIFDEQDVNETAVLRMTTSDPDGSGPVADRATCDSARRCGALYAAYRRTGGQFGPPRCGFYLG